MAILICAAASFTNMRKSVATSSLRLRPVCNFHPSGPKFFDQRFLDKMVHIFRIGRIQPSFVVSARARRFVPAPRAFAALRRLLVFPRPEAPWPTPDPPPVHKEADGDRTQMTAGTRRIPRSARGRIGRPTGGHLYVRSSSLLPASLTEICTLRRVDIHAVAFDLSSRLRLLLLVSR